MADYYISFARSARKELESLSAKLVQRIFPTIEALAIEPRPKGCRKLTTEKHLWRIRVGDYRVIYTIDDAEHVQGQHSYSRPNGRCVRLCWRGHRTLIRKRTGRRDAAPTVRNTA